jgi:hypothetical protein
MSANDIPFPMPADFDERARETYSRLASGEVMSHEQIANAIGLPIEFFEAALAIYVALMGWRPPDYKLN